MLKPYLYIYGLTIYVKFREIRIVSLPQTGTGREGIHDWVRNEAREKAQIRSEWGENRARAFNTNDQIAVDLGFLEGEKRIVRSVNPRSE